MRTYHCRNLDDKERKCGQRCKLSIKWDKANRGLGTWLCPKCGKTRVEIREGSDESGT